MKSLFINILVLVGTVTYTIFKLLIEPTLKWLLELVDDLIFIHHVSYGACCKYVDGGTMFWGRSIKARQVLDKVCYQFHRCRFGGYFVPHKYSKEVYERIMHDPKYPQCMSCRSKMLNCVIVDTP